jgi:hypothetical protein
VGVQEAPPAAANQQRLEDSVAAGEHRIVGAHHGMVGADESAVQRHDDVGAVRHGPRA